MPSEEWFRENPKVSAYITRELHQKLESWMEENGVKKVSQALTEILEAFLEPSKANDQVEALERKFEDRFAALENRIATIDLAMAEIKSSPKVVQISDKRQLSLDDVENSGSTVVQTEAKSRMTNNEVSAFTGLSYDQVQSRHKREKVLKDKGKVFTPVREDDKPVWVVTD